MKEIPYETVALQELQEWKTKMRKAPTRLNHLAATMQKTVNRYIPEKVHQALTSTIKQMVRAVLFGSERTSGKPAVPASLEELETKVRASIRFYQTTAAAEGGITGAGGILLGLADIPLLLSLKLKMLFDIATYYGYSVEDYKERLYLLHIFQLAFSSQAQRTAVFRQMENWESKKHQLPDDIHLFDWRTFQQEYRDYIDLAKMAQLIPVIGAPVGAVVNYKLIQKLGQYAMNAYRLRWQERQLLPENPTNL